MGVSVVILGAGQGKRMKSSTPKVLHKISDREMIFYPIEVSFGLSSDVNVVLFHQFEKVKKAILSEFKDVKIHKQDGLKYPGTAGALRGVEFENSRVLILNGDMPLITEESLKTLIHSKAPLAMSIIELENPSGYGRVVIEGSKVTKIVEEKDCTEEQKSIKSVNAGVYSIDRELLYRYIPKISNRNSQKEYYLTDIIQMAVDDGEVVKPILVDEREFKGVNTKLDLAEAENIMQKRVKNSLMLQGVGMSMPNTIFISSKASFDGECQIESGVVILGKTEIKNSRIGANSVVEDSKIFDSSIGPMARVRPNSIIKSSQIGNFVEVKNSTLNGVKAGHLSYLGDSFIDSGTNIGAGVITCNYDGKKKYHTRIGKNVFVGSDTQLIAPLVIEDDVIVGAGSTITKDVQSGSLALSRVAQKVVEGFFYRFFGRK
jgi:bifunctional UDP-N-acetylglucosamine pyrophosphorylase/glucosamine-1-phosphate N-acetyltransferase